MICCLHPSKLFYRTNYKQEEYAGENRNEFFRKVIPFVAEAKNSFLIHEHCFCSTNHSFPTIVAYTCGDLKGHEYDSRHPIHHRTESFRLIASKTRKDSNLSNNISNFRLSQPYFRLKSSVHCVLLDGFVQDSAGAMNFEKGVLHVTVLHMQNGLCHSPHQVYFLKL